VNGSCNGISWITWIQGKKGVRSISEKDQSKRSKRPRRPIGLGRPAWHPLMAPGVTSLNLRVCKNKRLQKLAVNLCAHEVE
jgi:hypothetical protein